MKMKLNKIINKKKEKFFIKKSFKYVLHGYTNLSANLLLMYINFMAKSSNFKPLMSTTKNDKLLKVRENNDWLGMVDIIHTDSRIIVTISKKTNRINIEIMNNILNIRSSKKYIKNDLSFNSEVNEDCIINCSYENNKELINDVVDLICLNALYTLRYV